MGKYNKILVIQTAFIGDVILVTSLLETLHLNFKEAKIDVVVRKGNESLFHNHPFINEVLVWDKKNKKTKNLFSLLFKIRKNNYDLAIGVQRFFNAGLLAAFSKAKFIIGFDKNPLSFMFNKKVPHVIGEQHEVERNYALVNDIAPIFSKQLKLYPTVNDYSTVKQYQSKPYIVIAPASVWFTKQFPKNKWIEFLNTLTTKQIFIIGAPSDIGFANEIVKETVNEEITNLCGKLNLLQSAALMQHADMCFVNDSAPQHLASAVNAPTTAIFCSTVPNFGFGPLATNSLVVQIDDKLKCRPCGLHGHKTCPETHFKCAQNIDVKKLKKRAELS